MAEKSQVKWDADRAKAKAKAAKVIKANALKARKDLEKLRKAAALGAVSGPVVETSDEDEADGYADHTNEELSGFLEERGLPHTGTKAELIARLEEADKASE